MKTPLLIISSCMLCLGAGLQANPTKAEKASTEQSARKGQHQRKGKHHDQAKQILRDIIAEQGNLHAGQEKKPANFMRTNEGKELKATIEKHLQEGKTAEEIKKESTLTTKINEAFTAYLKK